MSDDVLSRARDLPDSDLLARVRLLAYREREATVMLVAHLAVLDERRLYLGQGFSSLFTFCTQILHLSEHAAYNRIEVARAARKFPIVLRLLGDGSVNLTTVRLLAPHLTPANHADLLIAARHKGKRDIEELVAQYHPQPSVVSTVRMLPMARSDATSTTNSVATPEGPETAPGATALAPPTTTATHPAVIEPLGSRRYRVQFTASAETREKLRFAQDLLRHQIPNGDIGQIVDRALTALLEDLAREKFAGTDRPRIPSAETNGGADTNSRHIPAEVKRAVWLRDAGRCAFLAPTGRRCGEHGLLEFHHVVPYAAGGRATIDNMQLRCRAHNGYEAVLFFAGGPVAAFDTDPAASRTISTSRQIIGPPMESSGTAPPATGTEQSRTRVVMNSGGLHTLMPPARAAPR